MKKHKWGLALIGLVVVALVGWLVLKPLPVAPEVKFMTLNGETLRTADFRGKVWMVNFWATTCATCVKEMPALTQTRNAFAARGFELVAVAMDYDPPNYVAAFAKQHGLPFPVALDAGGHVAAGFGGVRLTPTTFLIDQQGRIVQQYLGEPDFERVHKLIDKLLKQEGA